MDIEIKDPVPESIYITRAGQGEHWQVGTDIVTIKASGRETSRRMLFMEVMVPPGGGPPALHRHSSAEIFYILEGEFQVTTVDADRQRTTETIGSGDTLAIPSLVWHNFKNVGTTAGRVLAFHSPAGMEQFAREVGQPLTDLHNPLQQGGPPSDEEKQRLLDVVEKYMEVW